VLDSSLSLAVRATAAGTGMVVVAAGRMHMAVEVDKTCSVAVVVAAVGSSSQADAAPIFPPLAGVVVVAAAAGGRRAEVAVAVA